MYSNAKVIWLIFKMPVSLKRISIKIYIYCRTEICVVLLSFWVRESSTTDAFINIRELKFKTVCLVWLFVCFNQIISNYIFYARKMLIDFEEL